MANVCIYEFASVARDDNGKITPVAGEPPIRRTDVTINTSCQLFTMTGSTRYAGLWPSSGGAALWYNAFDARSGPATPGVHVVSASYPDRKLTLLAEGDYEMFGVGPCTILGIVGA